MKQVLFDNLNAFICKIKKNRIYQVTDKGYDPIKANIGCALRVAPGWINVDATPHAMFGGWPIFFLKYLYKMSAADSGYTCEQYCNIMKNNKFIHHKIEYGLPFPDNSIKYIYSSHMLEHLYKEDSKKFLKEVYRVLVKNGVVRICVPDLEYAFSLYKNGDRENALRLFFVPTEYNYLYQHRYLYDYTLLKKYLNEAGFETINRCQYQQGLVPDIEKLDVFPDETLYIEAIKK
jgi:predicted SAM-dependent methyltransferase